MVKMHNTVKIIFSFKPLRDIRNLLCIFHINFNAAPINFWLVFLGLNQSEHTIPLPIISCRSGHRSYEHRLSEWHMSLLRASSDCQLDERMLFWWPSARYYVTFLAFFLLWLLFICFPSLVLLHSCIHTIVHSLPVVPGHCRSHDFTRHSSHTQPFLIAASSHGT